MLSVTLEIQSNENGQLSSTQQIELTGMGGYLANLDQSVVYGDQISQSNF
jgi:hypothetical protein